jgi:uncharacterized membrane protein YbaN (DUF454 family)
MDAGRPPQAAFARRLRRTLLFIAGSLSLVVGMIGIIVPVLPTTPFLLLAAICYARSSSRCYRWLVTNRVFGRYLDDYLQGRGVDWKVRSGALLLLWSVITLTAVLFTDRLWVRLLLFLMAVAVTVHVVTLKGRERQRIPES